MYGRFKPAWTGLKRFFARPHPALPGGAIAPRTPPKQCLGRAQVFLSIAPPPGRVGWGRAGNRSKPFHTGWSAAGHLL
eukprot:184013-Alexandrium_andersonii.AAC.1